MEMKDMIKKLKNLLDELAAEEDPEEMTTEIALPTPPHPRWKPELGDTYSTTYCAGFAAECHWIDDGLDKDFFSLGCVFRTKAEAESDAERLKVLAEMREWAGNYNDAFMLTCDTYRNKVFYVPAGDTWVHGEMRFATEEDADNCIKAVGEERLKKYYFMIPEGADENT